MDSEDPYTRGLDDDMIVGSLDRSLTLPSSAGREEARNARVEGMQGRKDVRTDYSSVILLLRNDLSILPIYSKTSL